MRIYIKISRNKELIPFDYQHLLTGVIHKWIGQNNSQHGKNSLYSFSWLQNARATKKGLHLESDSYFFFSAFEASLTKQIISGVMDDPSLFCGSRALDIQIKNAPGFGKEERFFMQSPILVKKRDGEKIIHVIYSDDEFGPLLTQNLANKLESVGLSSEGLNIALDDSYAFPQTKLVNYKGIKNRASLVPVIIKGSCEQIAFAWSIGLGHSTGIGFGAVK